MQDKIFSDTELRKILLDPVLFSEKLLWKPCVSETEEKFLRSKHKRKLLAAGRRWGKTTMDGIISLHTAVVIANGRGEIPYFSASWEQCEIFMDTINDLIEGANPVLKSLIKITNKKKYEITINGCNIYSKSATKTSKVVRGHGANVILMIRDEDAFIPDDSMKSIRPVRITNGAPEIVTSTTSGHNHFFKDFNSKVYEVYKVSTYDNKFLDKSEIDSERELLTESEFNQEYMAEFIDDRYSVFPQVLLDYATDFNRHNLDSPMPEVEYFMGVDLGRRKDATVICIGHSDRNHLYIDMIKEVIYLNDGKFWSRALDEIKSYIKLFNIKLVNIDQTGIGDKPTEDLRNSLSAENYLCDVKGVDFTRRLKNSKYGLMNGLLLKFERKEIHLPFCEMLIRQLKNIKFESSDSPSSKLETYGIFSSGSHDDYVAALLLCLDCAPSYEETFYCRSSEIQRMEAIQSPFNQDVGVIVTNPEDFLEHV